MALAAAAVVTAFSGCGSGGDEMGDGYISAQKFASGAITIRTYNFRALEITPQSKLGNANVNSPITIPPTLPGAEDGMTYETTNAVRCYGTIGVYGGVAYAAEFLYQVSGEEVGCITPTIIQEGAVDDKHFLNACGFLSTENIKDANGDIVTVSYERITKASMDGDTLQILLNFKTQRLTVITSAAGISVEYIDPETNSTFTAFADIALREATISFPYIVVAR